MSVRVCAESSCPNPVVYRGRCHQHARQHKTDRNRNTTGRRVYNSKRWAIARRRQLFEHPLCEQCGHIATDVHHRIDLADGGSPWDPRNLASLCHRCHSQITRGRQAA